MLNKNFMQANFIANTVCKALLCEVVKKIFPNSYIYYYYSNDRTHKSAENSKQTHGYTVHSRTFLEIA